MPAKDIKTICNIGTGTMGPGTAVVFAMAGYKVRLFGRTDRSLDHGFKGIDAALESYREHDMADSGQITAIRARITGTTTLEAAAADADFVIETVAEDIETKRKVFAALDSICPAHAIFASSTSGLSPTAIAEAVRRRDKFVVAHFWNPPHIVPVVEVVPGRLTAPETINITCDLLERTGKKPVVLKQEALGFIANRLQLALLREALYLVEQGIATPETVDTTMKHLARRLSATGPLETADLGGLDIFYNIAGYLLKDLCNSPDLPPALKEAFESGNLGAKTGKGFYDWSDAGRLNAIKKTREDLLFDWLKKE
jgi:3-hydroxybutyryl-CoA dehydrogenase